MRGPEEQLKRSLRDVSPAAPPPQTTHWSARAAQWGQNTHLSLFPCQGRDELWGGPGGGGGAGQTCPRARSRVGEFSVAPKDLAVPETDSSPFRSFPSLNIARKQKISCPLRSSVFYFLSSPEDFFFF